MSTPRDPCRRIAVVGGGAVGLLAATALRQAMPVTQIMLVGQQPSPASFSDFAPTSLSHARALHALIGMDESELLLKAGGSHRLVTRYRGWSASDAEGTMAYGERETGRMPASLAQILAEAGRFAPPTPGRDTPLAGVDYALRWNPAAYAERLVARAQAAGVQYLPGAVEAVEHGEGGLTTAVAVAGQGRVEADLFVDCSGPGATVSAAHPAFAMVDWSPTLPTRMVYIGQPTRPVIALEDRITLLGSGWQSQVAGRDGLYSMLGTGEGVDRETALAALGAPAMAAVRLAQGRMVEPWLGNVVAIGDASARFEPLGPYHFDLAQRQIEMLLELLPGRTVEPSERREYNRRSIMMMEAVHETLALHFACKRAQKVFGERPLPVGAAVELDQFTRRGRIPLREEDPLLPQERRALLRALGVKPGIAPTAQRPDPQVEKDAHRRFAARAQTALEFAPPYVQWLGSLNLSDPAPPE